MTVLVLLGIGMLGGTYPLPLYMQKGLGYIYDHGRQRFPCRSADPGILSTLSGFLTRYLKILPLVFAGVLVMSLSFYLASRFTIHTTHGSIMWVLYLRGFGMD